MNYMPEVAKMLGVELGERFKIDFDIYNSSNHNFDYYLSEDGIKLDKDGYGCIGNDVLCGLIYGDYTIKRKPWKPKVSEIFWHVGHCGEPQCWRWENGVDEYLNYYKLGNCYPTKEEAEKNKDKWIEFYKSDEVLEV